MTKEKEPFSPVISIDVHSDRLGNIAYSRLADLLDSKLGDREIEIKPVEEAEFVIQIKKALAKRAPYLG